MSSVHRHNCLPAFSAGLILCFMHTSRACNPDFPAQVITGDGAQLLDIPPGKFSMELDLLRPSGQPPFSAVLPSQKSDENVFAESARIDKTELEAALKQSNLAIDQKMLADYQSDRQQIMKYTQLCAEAEAQGPAALAKVEKLPAIEVPAGLPIEFDLYLRGLIALHHGEVAQAQKTWTRLLELPEDQRRHRTTWGAFMLGKSWLTNDPQKAIEFFKLTRKLAGEGFSDELGLASSSLGWEGRAEMNAGQYCQAIESYLQQRWTGDPTAEGSLMWCASRIFSSGEVELKKAAENPQARRVLTAYVISDFEPFYKMSAAEQKLIPAWLSAVESAAVSDMQGADRLAWMAYSSGDFTAAQRWIARSPATSAVANWVRAKLLLREGKNDEAARVLVKVIRSFPTSEDMDRHIEGMDFDGPQPVARSITSDLGVLQLMRGQYVDSMHLLMKSDHWEDAAYIAERVLTTDELLTFVNRFCPAGGQGNPGTAWVRCSDQLRELLARRLTRNGDWKQAREYFSDDLRTTLDAYVRGIRDGHDKSKSPADRAAGFMIAARIARKSGMDLLGTELEPDFHLYDGQFDDDEAKSRFGSTGVLAPSVDELTRTRATVPQDLRRFHYRYIAAGHAWSAAELLPDNDDQTAKDLNEGGSWLKAMNPDAANRFYRALVGRCPDTELGRRAIALRWFPKD